MATRIEARDYPRYVVDEPEQQRFLVHQDVYVDPAIFTQEMERLFEASWLYLAHESQVAQPNDYLTLHMGRQPVILARGEDGQLHCLLNRCRHRGALVCRAATGNSAHFRCFYHSWTYRNDGSLIGVADRAGYGPDFSTDDLALAPVPHLQVYKGFIFASLNPASPPLEVHLGNARPYLDLLVDKYLDGIEVAKGVTRYGYQGNWKMQVENALDFYHLPSVHKSQLDVGVLRGRRQPITFATMQQHHAVYFGHGHAATVSRHGPAEPDDGADELARRVGPERARWARSVHQHLLLFPNVVILENPGPQIRVIRPVAVDQTEVTGYAFFPKSVGAAERARRLRAYENFYGPVGMGTPDDVEAFHACMEGYRATAAPWNDLSRGIHRQQTTLDLAAVGPFELAGNITDDTIFRGLYRWWVSQMSHAPDRAAVLPGYPA